ncbi:MAG: pyridoxamine 5'-phosphate oxidase family protein, partial [Eubacterium sp.]
KKILKTCDTCRLAFNTGGAPYIVPLNFGYSFEQDELILYFHCANEGQKLSLLAKNDQVGFEMDCDHALIGGSAGCHYTFNYSSIIGFGNLEIIQDTEERKQGLMRLMAHYTDKEDWIFDKKVLAMTTILKLKAAHFTGKANKRENV